MITITVTARINGEMREWPEAEARRRLRHAVTMAPPAERARAQRLLESFEAQVTEARTHARRRALSRLLTLTALMALALAAAVTGLFGAGLDSVFAYGCGLALLLYAGFDWLDAIEEVRS